jgi:hypothetical protein
MDCALDRCCRASPSRPPAQAPHGVGCDQRPSHEPKRPASRLRVRSFPAINDPAGNTTSADFSTASSSLSAVAVPHHPANRTSGEASGTPVEISPGKTSNLHRAPTASTQRPLDNNGLRCNRPARPDRPASYAQPNATTTSGHVFLGSRFRLRLPSHPASRRRSCPWLVVGVISSTGDLHPRAADHAGRTGRDRRYQRPPAQIPACASNALGSSLGFWRPDHPPRRSGAHDPVRLTRHIRL